MYPDLRRTEGWTLPAALAFWACERGAHVFVETVEGEALTYAEAEDEAARVAGHLAGLGVRPGDRVLVMLPNGLDFVRAWLGLGRLGAVFVVLNTGLSGAFLAHQLRASGAAVAIVAEAFLPELARLADEAPALERIIVSGTGADAHPAPAPWPVSRFAEWRAAPRYDGPMPAFSDTACLAFTSGTTGPAKGVLMPHAHCFLFGLGAVDNLGVGPQDRYYVALPLFHVNGLLMQVAACLIAGATVILRERFSASAWLGDIRRLRATRTNLLGVMAQFVLEQRPTEHDRDHALRGMLVGPYLPEQDAAFRARFGIPDIQVGFGMTEVNIPLWGRPPAERAPPGCAGRVYDRYFEVEIRHPETDAPLARGEVGEIMVRPKVGFGFMAGYDGLPDKTCEAWRNLWFHTGDAGTMDESGLVCFVDRIKDCIRRRGENISSTEVEAAMLDLPGASEVAAFAVKSSVAGGEDEVMIVLVPAPGASLTLADVAAHADRVLPRFARPRFLEIRAELPKTGTGKLMKTELRRAGVGPATWDRDTGASGPTHASVTSPTAPRTPRSAGGGAETERAERDGCRTAVAGRTA